ncbi:MAG: crossover junction endodeoxyribonuclease RuvC [Verrucomicrobiales bacterium]
MVPPRKRIPRQPEAKPAGGAGPDRAPAKSLRILSIDPALRNTGYAVIEVARDRAGRPSHRAITYGVIANKASMRQSGCLVAIRERLDAIIREHAPEVCAVEAVIYVQSFKTAITLVPRGVPR